MLAKKIYHTLDDVMAETKIASRLGVKGFTLKEIGKEVDMVVLIGGDGTILMALEHIKQPVFSINTGSVGFLTEVEAHQATEGLKKVLRGEYFVEKRMKLNVTLNKKDLGDATNEVTIHTAKIGKILTLQLAIDGVVAEEIDGDGVIIASPTGSTSYAYSVGGPLVDPSLQAFVIAPMAPFRHITSPMVIPGDKTISVKILVKKMAKIVIDGMHMHPFSSKDTLLVTRSNNTASFIRLENNFYKKVFERLAFRHKKFENEENTGD
jgi:NAD+ kinase